MFFNSRVVPETPRVREASRHAADFIELATEAATFQQVLHSYRAGRATEAIRELAAWPVDRLLVRTDGDVVARPGYWVSSSS